MIRLAEGRRLALLQSIAAATDAGSGPGVLNLYDSTELTPDAAPAGVLLASITLNDPAFGTPTDTTLPFNVTPMPEGEVLVAGFVTYARVTDSTGTTIFDGQVGAEFDTYQKMLVLPDPNLVLGDTLSLDETVIVYETPAW